MAGADAASKVLTVTGTVVVAKLQCEVGEKTGTAGEKVATHSYKVLSEEAGVGAMPVNAGVALKPWTGVIDGEQVETVIRAPYGEPWPRKSWTGDCLCLRICRQINGVDVGSISTCARSLGAHRLVE